MNFRKGGGGLRSSFVIVLGALFCLLAMGVVFLSGGTYNKIVADADRTYDRRIAISYLTNQVRQFNRCDEVSVEAFGDGDALVLTRDGYETRLYCSDGQLCELYTEAGTALAPEDGIAITGLDALHVSFGAEGALLQIQTEQDGARWETAVRLHPSEPQPRLAEVKK